MRHARTIARAAAAEDALAASVLRLLRARAPRRLGGEAKGEDAVGKETVGGGLPGSFMDDTTLSLGYTTPDADAIAGKNSTEVKLLQMPRGNTGLGWSYWRRGHLASTCFGVLALLHSRHESARPDASERGFVPYAADITSATSWPGRYEPEPTAAAQFEALLGERA